MPPFGYWGPHTEQRDTDKFEARDEMRIMFDRIHRIARVIPNADQDLETQLCCSIAPYAGAIKWVLCPSI